LGHFLLHFVITALGLVSAPMLAIDSSFLRGFPYSVGPHPLGIRGVFPRSAASLKGLFLLTSQSAALADFNGRFSVGSVPDYDQWITSQNCPWEAIHFLSTEAILDWDG
jgi:hypothetical protein